MIICIIVISSSIMRTSVVLNVQILSAFNLVYLLVGFSWNLAAFDLVRLLVWLRLFDRTGS
jgi:hypothetical protein